MIDILEDWRLRIVFVAVGFIVIVAVFVSAYASIAYLSGNGPDLPQPAGTTDLDCHDFATWESAQSAFDLFHGDPYRLDADGDGIACEYLLGRN